MAGNAPKHERVPPCPIIYRHSLLIPMAGAPPACAAWAAGRAATAAGRVKGRRGVYHGASGGGGVPHMCLPPGSSSFIIIFFLRRRPGLCSGRPAAGPPCIRPPGGGAVPKMQQTKQKKRRREGCVCVCKRKAKRYTALGLPSWSPTLVLTQLDPA